MSFIGALATFGATAAGLVGIGTGAVAGTAGAGMAAGALSVGAAASAGAATGTALGAGIGAISAAAQGQDVGKGALMGAASGLVTAGVGSGVSGAAGGALTNAVGSTASNAITGGVAGAAGGAAGAAVGGEDVGKGALIGGASGAVAGGVTGALTPTPGANAGPFQLTELASGTPHTVGTVNPAVGPATTYPIAPQGPAPALIQIGTNTVAYPTTTAGLAGLGPTNNAVLKGLGAGAVTNYVGTSMVNSQNAADLAAKEDAARGVAFANQNNTGLAALQAAGLPTKAGPLAGLGKMGKATGGLTALAHGGQVPLKDGAYIIPADVVSALGNGSSKAGAQYLRQLMIEVRKEAVNLQGLGGAKKRAS